MGSPRPADRRIDESDLDETIYLRTKHLVSRSRSVLSALIGIDSSESSVSHGSDELMPINADSTGLERETRCLTFCCCSSIFLNCGNLLERTNTLSGFIICQNTVE